MRRRGLGVPSPEEIAQLVAYKKEHKRFRLNEKFERTILKMYNTGMSKYELQRDYGLCYRTTGVILRKNGFI